MPRMGSSQQIDLQQGTVHSLEVSWPEKKRERVWWEQPEIDLVQSSEQVAPDAGGGDINPWIRLSDRGSTGWIPSVWTWARVSQTWGFIVKCKNWIRYTHCGSLLFDSCACHVKQAFPFILQFSLVLLKLIICVFCFFLFCFFFPIVYYTYNFQSIQTPVAEVTKYYRILWLTPYIYFSIEACTVYTV